METIKKFRISENSKNYDLVELLKDNVEYKYIVRWKWTTMRITLSKEYDNYIDALEKYTERKKFAILCN